MEQLERIKVLLIEDVPPFARVLQDMLAQAKGIPFEVVWAESLRDGLKSLGQVSFDLVLLELSLAQSDGLESFEQAHALAERVPIIVLSSLDDQNLALQAVQEGAQDYLFKDQITESLLIRSVRYAIGRKRAEMAAVRAEEKYRGIFEHIVEGVFQTTAEGRYVSANPALARIYGYDTSEQLMRRLTDIVRSLNERTRGDITNHLSQQHLEHSMRRLETLIAGESKTNPAD